MNDVPIHRLAQLGMSEPCMTGGVVLPEKTDGTDGTTDLSRQGRG